MYTCIYYYVGISIQLSTKNKNFFNLIKGRADVKGEINMELKRGAFLNKILRISKFIKSANAFQVITDHINFK